MSRSLNSKMGRGHGQSFRTGDSLEKSNKTDHRRSSMMPSKKNINFDPKQFIVAQCSIKDVEVYKQVFDFLDQDHDGMLTPLDLRKNMRECGYKPGRAFVYVAMSVFDADDGGQISFKQFVKLMTQKPCQNDTDDDIERIFTYFDEDNKGFISPEDLMAAAEQLHEELTLQEAHQMVRQCDPQNNGVITLESYIKYNKKKTF